MTDRLRLLVVLTGLFIAAACGGLSPGETIPPTVAPLCIDFAAVQARIAEVRDLDPATSTTDDVNEAVTSLQSAWLQLGADAADAAQEGYPQLSSAIADVNRAISEMPAGTTAEEAIALLEEPIDDLMSAQQTASAELGCPPL